MALFPTAYFPSILYIKTIGQYEAIEIEIQETFPKQTIRTRTSIFSSNGALLLSVPIKHNSLVGNQKTQNILIDNSRNWQLNHLRAIKSAYASAPYFDDYFWKLEELLQPLKYQLLVEMNLDIIHFFLESIGLNVNITLNSSFIKNHEIRDMDFLDSNTKLPVYYQVFSNKFEFKSNLSFLDLLMNEGPLARNYILS